jgi:hypothetical protein
MLTYPKTDISLCFFASFQKKIHNLLSYFSISAIEYYVRFEVFTAVTMKNGVFYNPEDTILQLNTKPQSHKF